MRKMCQSQQFVKLQAVGQFVQTSVTPAQTFAGKS